MGSRARIAAAAYLLAAGVLVGGAGAAAAVADTGSVGADGAAHNHADDAPGQDGPTDADDRPDAGGEDAAPADTPADTGQDAPVEIPDGDDEGEPAVETEDGPAPGDRRDPDGDPVGDGDEGIHQEEQPRPPCCEGGKDGCDPGWPWPWPRPNPNEPGNPPTSDGEYGEDRPETTPPMLPGPPLWGPGGPDVLDIVPGLPGASDAAEAPIDVPIMIASPIGAGPGIGPVVGPGSGAAPASGGTGTALPAAPRQGTAPPPSRPPPRKPLPAATGNSVAIPAAGSRAGYAEHLRSAGIPQLAALALPGLAGILVLTGAGGLLGYRQAKAGQAVRPSAIARFMN